MITPEQSRAFQQMASETIRQGIFRMPGGDLLTQFFRRAEDVEHVTQLFGRECPVTLGTADAPIQMLARRAYVQTMRSVQIFTLSFPETDFMTRKISATLDFEDRLVREVTDQRSSGLRLGDGKILNTNASFWMRNGFITLSEQSGMPNIVLPMEFSFRVFHPDKTIDFYYGEGRPEKPDWLDQPVLPPYVRSYNPIPDTGSNCDSFRQMTKLELNLFWEIHNSLGATDTSLLSLIGY